MKAAIYIRVSTHHQIDRDSLPFQRNDLTNYCDYALNISDYVVFEDAGYSAKNTDRPKFQEMMTRIRRGEFSHLVVWKLDRISRNLLDFAGMWEELKEHGVNFVSKMEQFDTSSAMGEAMLKIILVFAELERKLTGERVMSIMLNRAEKGLWNGAPVPIGYDWDHQSKSLAINDAEAAVVQIIYDMYEKSGSTLDVLRHLHRTNAQTKRGGKWTAKGVRDVLRSPVYKGTLRYNYRKAARGKVKSEDEWILVDNAVPPIVSEVQWERVQQMLDDNYKGQRSIREKAKHTHVFSGLLKCAHCGGSFLSMQDRPRKDGFRPSTYRCSTAAMMSRGDEKLCTSFVADVKIGPFVLQYLKNLVSAAAEVRSTRSFVNVDEILLSDMPGELAGIEGDLTDTFTGLFGATNELMAKPKTKDGKTINTQLLEQNQAKYERALERLDRAYLFDDSNMSEKDYLVKRTELQERLTEVTNEIKRLRLAAPGPGKESEFIKRASVFLMTKELLTGDADFVSLIRRGHDQDSDEGKKLLRKFMASVITRIDIKGKRVSAIHFVGGVTHRFIYR